MMRKQLRHICDSSTVVSNTGGSASCPTCVCMFFSCKSERGTFHIIWNSLDVCRLPSINLWAQKYTGKAPLKINET